MSSYDNILPPKIINQVGSFHPINQIKDYLISILSEYGFQEVDGPEIETKNITLIC